MVAYKNLLLVYAALALATYTQKNKKQKPPINADDVIPQKSGTPHSFAIGGYSKSPSVYGRASVRFTVCDLMSGDG